MPRIRCFDQIKNDININLEKHHQKVKILEFKTSHLLLNNNLKIDNLKERQTFLRRCESILYVNYIDMIYDPIIDMQTKEKTLKSIRKKHGLLAYESKTEEQKNASKNNFLNYVENHLRGKPSIKKGIPTNRPPWSKGKSKYNDERLKRISENMKGDKNPSVRLYDKIFTNEYKSRHSENIKKRILNGKFTPQTRNSMTNWTSSCLNKFFRSSWEAAFYYQNQNLLYEKLRIPYVDCKGNSKIYISDFVDEINRIIYEIKPNRIIETKFKKKLPQIITYCNQNNYQFQLISEEEIYKIVKSFNENDFQQFDLNSQQNLKKFIYNEINKKNRN